MPTFVVEILKAAAVAVAGVVIRLLVSPQDKKPPSV